MEYSIISNQINRIFYIFGTYLELIFLVFIGRISTSFFITYRLFDDDIHGGYKYGFTLTEAAVILTF